MKIRTYSDISSELVGAIPRRDEMKEFGDEEIQTLRRFVDMVDNVFYLELQRRLADEERKAI